MISWHAFHIYYFSDPECLLRNIHNILQLAQNTYEDFDFFFIRYWNGGPHLRLRVKTNSKDILEFLNISISNVLKNNPSRDCINKRQYIEEEGKLRISSKEEETILPIQSNNSILIADYHPEYEKYFGIEGVKIAEKEFIYSSKLALKIIDIEKFKNLKYLVSVAFLDYLLSSVMLDINTRSFTLNYGAYWNNFTSNKKKFNQYGNVKFTEESIKKVQAIILLKDVLNFHKTIFKEIDEHFPQKNRSLNFLFNFYHLFNNRIGITPIEEVIVSRIAFNSLK